MQRPKIETRNSKLNTQTLIRRTERRSGGQAQSQPSSRSSPRMYPPSMYSPSEVTQRRYRDTSLIRNCLPLGLSKPAGSCSRPPYRMGAPVMHARHIRSPYMLAIYTRHMSSSYTLVIYARSIRPPSTHSLSPATDRVHRIHTTCNPFHPPTCLACATLRS